MSNDPAVASVGTAQALLSSLRGVKDDFRELDAAVNNHLRDSSERATKAALVRRRFLRAMSWAWPGQLAGRTVAVAAGEWYGIGDATWLTSPGSATAFACTIVGGGVAGTVAWRRDAKHVAAETATRDRRRDDFLLAGVAVELALGDLRTALDDARRHRPGSAATLAAQAVAAREAFEHYIAAGRTLDENDVTVPVPGLGDVDVADAHELLSVNAEAVLAQIGFVATDADSGAGLSGSRQPVTAATSTGGLDAVVAAAEALRTTLEADGRILKDVEEAVLQTARRATDADAQTLQRLGKVVAEAHLRATLVEADCLAIANAGHEAAKADTRAQIVHHLAAAPPAAIFRNAFVGYATSVTIAAQQLVSMSHHESLGAAASAARIASDDLSRLAPTAHALAGAVHAEHLRVSTSSA